jgi:starch phosphorylase
MFDGHNGWAITSSDEPDPGLRDDMESSSMYETLSSIRDEYHDDRRRFNDRVRHAWKTLGPQVTAGRMVRDYMEQVYGPALERT